MALNQNLLQQQMQGLFGGMTEEEKRKQMIESLRQQQAQPMAGYTGLQEKIIPPGNKDQQDFRGQIAAKDRAELQKMRRRQSAGTKMIGEQDVKNPWSALAKVGAMMGGAYFDRKAGEKDASALEKTLQGAANTAEKEKRRLLGIEEEDRGFEAEERDLNAAYKTAQMEASGVQSDEAQARIAEMEREAEDPLANAPTEVVEYSYMTDAEPGTREFQEGFAEYMELNRLDIEKPPGTEKRLRLEFLNVGDEARAVRDAFDALNAENIEVSSNDFFQAVEQGVYNISPTMGNIITSAVRSGDRNRILDEMENLSATLIHDKYGGQFTGNEAVRGGRWDPGAGGLDDERRKQRLDGIIRNADRGVHNIEAGYKDYYSRGKKIAKDADDTTKGAPKTKGKGDAPDSLMDSLFDQGMTPAEVTEELERQGYN